MADILKSCGKWYKHLWYEGDGRGFKKDESVLYAGFIVKVTPGGTYTVKAEWNKCASKRRFNILGFRTIPTLGMVHDTRYNWGNISNSVPEKTLTFSVGSDINYIYIYFGWDPDIQAYNVDKIVKNVELITDTPQCSNPTLPEEGEPVPRFSKTDTPCDKPLPPLPPEPPKPEDPTEGTGTSCPTSGIYGGYGTKLTDIKLFLYAANVTNGTIKLNKPQLEVGTVATDWRPNADEAIKHYTPAYKQVKGLAIQQGSNGKKNLEIPTVEGTIYGVDLWGGDTAKLLKDEIAELKEQIKELKNQIK